MKKYFIMLPVMALLCSCGQTVGTDSDISVTSPASTETNPTESALSAESATTTTTTATAVTSAGTSELTSTTAKPSVNKNPPDDVYISVADTVEIYNSVTLAELVTDKNVEFAEPDTLLDTSETGEKSIDVVFSYEGELYEKNITYTVADTTPPLVLNSGWTPYTKINEPFDINKIIGYADNYDSSPEVSYTGEVDTESVGAYPITVTVTDSAGNSTSWDLTVFVVHDIPEPEDNNDRVEFSDFMERYSYYENISYGIDVSAWQTNVDYNAVKAEGVEFVLIRMGYCYSDIYMDDYYYSNIENAENAGLDTGIYFYTTANTEDKAREQAQWIIKTLEGRQLDFPIAFDWENWENFQQYGISLHELNNIYYAFCDELEKSGYSGMLYSSKNFLVDVWENEINTPVWLAHYVDETDYTGSYAIWQASAYGRITGIDGDVDMNIKFNDVPVE